MNNQDHIKTTLSSDFSIEKIWEILETVSDPEIPVLSITDLGIVRNVTLENENIVVTITPTYSGCPAMDMIAVNIKLALAEAGFKNVLLKAVLAPAWTTDWMTKEGKEKLLKYGIAPPNKSSGLPHCPQCNSPHTKLLSQFGSTACKALYQCEDCKEPFDYFKCH